MNSSSALCVLHLRNACGYYGADHAIVTWIQDLASRGYRFELAVFDYPSRSTSLFLREAERAGATVHLLPRTHRKVFIALRRLIRIIRKRHVSIIHAHDNRSHVLGWLAGLITGTPVVGTIHGYVHNSSAERISNFVDRLILTHGFLAQVTAPSRELCRQFKKAMYLPNAVHADLADHPLVAEKLPESPHFGVVARLSQEKGVHVFLDALAYAPPSWRYCVLGEGPQREELLRHPLSHRVKWLGFCPDVVDNMRTWTGVIVPSLSEGLPLVILEAMALGIPIVATRTGGIVDVIQDGIEGIIVPPDNPEALAQGMMTIINDDAAASQRAVQARQRFRENFTTDRLGCDLHRLYLRVVRGG